MFIKTHARQPHTFPAKNNSGFLLVSLLVTTFLTVAVAIATAELVVSSYKQSQQQHYTVNAQLVTDAGVDHAVGQLNANASWTGSGGEQTLIDNGSIKLTYTSTLVNGADAEHKILTVTGKAYKSGSATPTDTRKAEVVLQGAGGSGVGGDIAAYAGVGGLIMDNYAEIANGQVFVNGTIQMTDYSAIGTSGEPVDVRAAHQSCPIPANSTYPQICTSGQPISIDQYSEIHGEVTANNQTTGVNMEDPGLVSGSVAPSALPSHNRTAVTSPTNPPAQTTQTGTTAGCTTDIDKVWPANLRITGNVIVEDYCDVTVEGDVWITGNLTVDDYATLKVKDGLTSPPNIVVDGSTGVVITNYAELRSNNASPDPIGFRVVTYWSADTSCRPNCTDVTGTALYNSRNLRTILISDNAIAPNSQLYARWTKVHMDDYGAVGALVGQTIELTNYASIELGVAIDESESGTLSWSIESYKRVFN